MLCLCAPFTTCERDGLREAYVALATLRSDLRYDRIASTCDGSVNLAAQPTKTLFLSCIGSLCASSIPFGNTGGGESALGPGNTFGLVAVDGECAGVEVSLFGISISTLSSVVVKGGGAAGLAASFSSYQRRATSLALSMPSNKAASPGEKAPSAM